MDIWIVFTFWILRIILLWTVVYNIVYNICVHLFFFNLDVSLGVDFIGHMLDLYLTLWGTRKLFSKAGLPFNIPTNSISSVQSLSHVTLFATTRIAACQASLSITISRSSLRLTSSESVMPSSHLILCRPVLLLPPIPPSIRVFSNESLFTWGGQSIGVSALASFLPKKSQGWSPSEWTGWISLESKGLSRVFSNTTVQKHQFFGAQFSSQSNSHLHTWPLEKA